MFDNRISEDIKEELKSKVIYCMLHNTDRQEFIVINKFDKRYLFSHPLELPLCIHHNMKSKISLFAACAIRRDARTKRVSGSHRELSADQAPGPRMPGSQDAPSWHLTRQTWPVSAE